MLIAYLAECLNAEVADDVNDKDNLVGLPPLTATGPITAKEGSTGAPAFFATQTYGSPMARTQPVASTQPDFFTSHATGPADPPLLPTASMSVGPAFSMATIASGYTPHLPIAFVGAPISSMPHAPWIAQSASLPSQAADLDIVAATASAVAAPRSMSKSSRSGAPKPSYGRSQTCWGFALKRLSRNQGLPCTPGFVPGRAHFKNKQVSPHANPGPFPLLPSARASSLEPPPLTRAPSWDEGVLPLPEKHTVPPVSRRFCDSCRSIWIDVPASHVRAIPDTLKLKNSSRSGLWSTADIGKVQGCMFRLGNNTQACHGPLFAVFASVPPADVEWAPLPPHWLSEDGKWVSLVVARGALVAAVDLTQAYGNQREQLRMEAAQSVALALAARPMTAPEAAAAAIAPAGAAAAAAPPGFAATAASPTDIAASASTSSRTVLSAKGLADLGYPLAWPDFPVEGRQLQGRLAVPGMSLLGARSREGMDEESAESSSKGGTTIGSSRESSFKRIAAGPDSLSTAPKAHDEVNSIIASVTGILMPRGINYQSPVHEGHSSTSDEASDYGMAEAGSVDKLESSEPRPPSPPCSPPTSKVFTSLHDKQTRALRKRMVVTPVLYSGFFVALIALYLPYFITDGNHRAPISLAILPRLRLDQLPLPESLEMIEINPTCALAFTFFLSLMVFIVPPHLEDKRPSLSVQTLVLVHNLVMGSSHLRRAHEAYTSYQRGHEPEYFAAFVKGVCIASTAVVLTWLTLAQPAEHARSIWWCCRAMSVQGVVFTELSARILDLWSRSISDNSFTQTSTNLTGMVELSSPSLASFTVTNLLSLTVVAAFTPHRREFIYKCFMGTSADTRKLSHRSAPCPC